MSGRQALAAVLAAAVSLGLAACGGGGGGGTSPPPPPPPPSQGITFTTASGASTSVVALRSVGVAGTRITLEVRAEMVNDLYGVAFDLSYPTSLFRLSSQSEGTFLGQGGAATTFQAVEPTPGTLVIGVSRLGALGGASGSGPLVTLVFDAIAAGSGNFSFTHNQAFAADGTPSGSVGWLGGMAQVVL